MNHQTLEREQLKIVIVGHVDHGKSTLVGRIFYDTDSLPEGKYEQIQAMCKKRGMPFEWSFLMDALQDERNQGITIDTTQIWFKTKKRDYVIIDAPGHKEFLKNMITGAANSDAALLVIDAKEGVQEQSKRHGYLLHLLGISQVAVAVNKMDLANYDEKVFKEIESQYKKYLKSIGVVPTYIIPISGREGDLITGPSQNMKWYKGPSILESLDHFKLKPSLAELSLRFPVQDVYKFDERRIIAGRIESGSLKVGDRLVFSPSNKSARIKTIEKFGATNLPKLASAGESIGVTLDEQIFVERGHIASHEESAPFLTNVFRARIFYLGRHPLTVGHRYRIKINTSEWQVEVKAIEKVIDTDNLSYGESLKVERNSVAEVMFRVRGLAAMDEFQANSRTGRFVMMEGFDVVGGGIVDLKGFRNQRSETKVKSTHIHPVEMAVNAKERELLNGHRGGVLWFTGLSGSGKTTLAKELQKRLFARGYQVYVLDGDNIRSGLCSDLGFSPDERHENIRRVGEVAALFAEAGTIVISAFISPYKKDRDRARAASPESFHCVYIRADVKDCEKRDPKGLYKKARAGEIKDFTGVSAPYEEPENADLVIDTTNHDIEQSLAMLLDYVENNFVNPVRNRYVKQDEYEGSEI